MSALPDLFRYSSEVAALSGQEILEGGAHNPHAHPQVIDPRERPVPQKEIRLLSEPAEPVTLARVLYLVELPDDRYRLKGALAVFLEEEGEGWSVFREDLGIFAYGATIDEALTHFAQSLLDDYDFYTSAEPEGLTEGGCWLAERLREVMERQ